MYLRFGKFANFVCFTLLGGGSSSGGVSDPSQWRKLMHSHDFVHDRLTKLRVESSSEPQNGYLPMASPESAESSRKRGKLSRSSSSNLTSKRSRLILLDDTVRDNDSKELCGQGSTLSGNLRVCNMFLKFDSGCYFFNLVTYYFFFV